MAHILGFEKNASYFLKNKWPLSNALSFDWYKIVMSSKNGNLLKITMAFMFDALQSSGDYFASIFGPKKIMHLWLNLLWNIWTIKYNVTYASNRISKKKRRLKMQKKLSAISQGPLYKWTEHSLKFHFWNYKVWGGLQ